MQLPIDYRSRPIKEKYLDFETPMFARWVIFGEYDDGTVAITDPTGADVFTHVPKDVAEQIIHARDNFVSEICGWMGSYEDFKVHLLEGPLADKLKKFSHQAEAVDYALSAEEKDETQRLLKQAVNAGDYKTLTTSDFQDARDAAKNGTETSGQTSED